MPTTIKKQNEFLVQIFHLIPSELVVLHCCTFCYTLAYTVTLNWNDFYATGDCNDSMVGSLLTDHTTRLEFALTMTEQVSGILV